MKKYLKLISIGIFISLISCSDSNDSNTSNPIPSNDSFLPMSIGNYWKNNEENFTEIRDTLRIQGDLYYEFYSLIGGDGVSIEYLRIDENQNLIGSYPNNPDFKYIHAKFNEQLGSTFWTINDQSVNDFKTTVIEKEDSSIAFEFQRVYHPNAKDKHIVKYVRGLGWNNFNEIKIDEDLFKF
ncbi:hypothetical protein MWU76_08690 [Gelidibacter sp. F2691]|uniref:hypothetical protein n=1 Tax=uncultured Gelidibacter sp. TaxID=259318 RepID=UPI001FF3F4CE|nr:hypothetical protein [uncultured Gelidibacter sp.]MCK0124477.1 hypothetical protein [Gelidibacter sp. F2691]